MPAEADFRFRQRVIEVRIGVGGTIKVRQASHLHSLARSRCL
jgi:hypothetical protein